MSSPYSIAQRTPAFNRLLSGLACATALTLTVGPALAQSQDMERVEINGRVIEAPARYDVHAACDDLEAQLQGALERTWAVEGRYGEVKVQFVMENGDVGAVEAQGISRSVARDVRAAVNRLHCGPQTTASAQIYRFSVDFVDPRAPASDTATASGKPRGVRVALLSR
jgi:hypothetical protein